MDREPEIQALSAFLAAEPEQWSQLVPRMLEGVGEARLREIVKTARRRVGRVEAVRDSPEGLVIIGHRSRVLVWVPFGDGDLVGPMIGLGLAPWWIVEVLLARRHRWGLATSVPLQMPVRGRWYVADGGVPGRTNRYQGESGRQRSGSVDLLQVGPWGSRPGPAGRLESYLAYGQEVYSPCAGTVVAALDGLGDQAPGAARFAPVDGNHVLIDTGREVVRLAHLRCGSILVDPGDQVHAGQLLGEVGNSGRSNQPHLTMDAVRAGRKLDLVFTGIEGNLYSGRTVGV